MTTISNDNNRNDICKENKIEIMIRGNNDDNIFLHTITKTTSKSSYKSNENVLDDIIIIINHY